MNENNNCPLVSVISLTYRNSKNLAGTLDSVFRQDYGNIELIISDDCSEDFDIDYFKKYAAANKSKKIIKVKLNQNKSNLGTVAHANLMVTMSEGKYIKFLSCGDEFYASDSLSKLIAFLEDSGAGVLNTPVAAVESLTGIMRYRYPSKKMIKNMNAADPAEQFAELSVRNVIGAAGSIFLREFYDSLGGFDEDYRLTEDWPFWLKICRCGHKIISVDKICVKYLLGGISTKSRINPVLYKEMGLLIEKEVFPYMHLLPKNKQREVKYVHMKALSWSYSDKIARIKCLLLYPDIIAKRLCDHILEAFNL